GDLHDRTGGCERTLQDGDAAEVVDGVVEGVDHLAIGGGRIEHLEVLRHGAAGDGDLVAVQQPLLEQHAHDDGHAADAGDVLHVVRAVRLGGGEVRDPGGDLVEVVQLELDVRLVRDREQVEHRVGGPAERHDHRDRVLERPLGEDVPRADVPAEQVE